MRALPSLPAFARRCARRAGALLATRPQAQRAVSGAPGSRNATTASESVEDATVEFRCNLCGRQNRVSPAQIARETRSCEGCGSTVRFRAIGRLVTRELLGRDAVLADLGPDRRLRGLGLSDADAYAQALGKLFAYENTFFHTTPRLDILNVPDDRRGRYDFVIASDVFEHVMAPVARAFENARALLAPRGIFIFTVPFTLAPDTVEHFPELHDWRLETRDGHWRVVNTKRDGRVQSFEDPVFHGGPGTTLEMRVFSHSALVRHFAEAGFARMRIANEPCAAFGIAWPEAWSVPIVAYAS